MLLGVIIIREKEAAEKRSSLSVPKPHQSDSINRCVLRRCPASWLCYSVLLMCMIADTRYYSAEDCEAAVREAANGIRIGR